MEDKEPISSKSPFALYSVISTRHRKLDTFLALNIYENIY